VTDNERMATPENDRSRTGAAAADIGGPTAEPVQPTAPVERPEQGPEQPPRADTTRPAPVKIKHTRISGTWVAVIVAVIVLIFLLIFILQNLATITVHFLGAQGSLPAGVGLLFAAVAGALLVVLIGTARIVQLRRTAKKAGAARHR
jgi:uncharacterized integral membrane protein